MQDGLMGFDALDVAIEAAMDGVDAAAHFAGHACADQEGKTKYGCNGVVLTAKVGKVFFGV